MSMSRKGHEILTDEIKKYITQIKYNHPQRTMKEIRADVRLYLIDKIKKENPEKKDKDIVRMVDDDSLVPGESSINKFLTPVNQKIKNKDSQDYIWTIGSLVQFELVKEVVPIILAEQNRRNENKYAPIETRQALWVSRHSFDIITA
jgi:hypothetical protein